MRRLLASPVALAFILTLAITACGGSSKATNTVVAPTKGAASPTSTRDNGGASGSPGTSGGGSVGVKPASPTTAAGPTATRKPATVISTPRKIATKPPTLAPNPTATIASESTDTPDTGEPTATVESGGLDPLLGQDFSVDATPFYEGTTDSGITMGVADGAYSIQLPANFWQISVTDDSAAPDDGVIVADLSIADGAYGGVVARDLIAQDGSYALYICWLGYDGSAGCSLNENNDWTTLFSVDSGTVPLQDVNTLTMSVVGSTIAFAVGDTIYGSADDTNVVGGYWGLYAESPQDAGATVVFDNVALFAAAPDFQLGQ